MKKFFSIYFFSLLSLSINAQEAEIGHRGTIKVQRKGQLAKVLFDNINYRLVGIDMYGNVLDSAVLEFKMSVTIQGIFYSEKTTGPQLTFKMIQLLGRCDQTTKIFFDDINAKDKSGTLVKMPKFQYTFGYSDENGD